jgi:hypothetical protein
MWAVFDDYGREVRPRFRVRRTFQRTVYRPGFSASEQGCRPTFSPTQLGLASAPTLVRALDNSRATPGPCQRAHSQERLRSAVSDALAMRRWQLRAVCTRGRPAPCTTPWRRTSSKEGRLSRRRIFRLLRRLFEEQAGGGAGRASSRALVELANLGAASRH